MSLQRSLDGYTSPCLAIAHLLKRRKCWNYLNSPYFFKTFLKFIFREGKGEREGQKHQCVVASHTPLTEDLACNPGTCPD